MTWTFVLLAGMTLAAAIAAMVLRNLVHCALCLAVAFGGLAAIYLQLNAQFIGLAQVLIYIGAVAVLILFAVLLTRGLEPPNRSVFSTGWLIGLLAAVAVFCALAGTILSGRGPAGAASQSAEAGVREIGDLLMHRYVLPLQVVGLLLTAALIGAVVIALRREGSR